jgi:transposase, IS5 family
LKAAYGRLIATAKRTAAQGKRVWKVLQERADEPGPRRLVAPFEEFLPRLKQGIEQARRRVLENDPVPASEKLLSLFEPHTQVIPRFKAGHAVEFGRKLRLDEVEGGIITGYAVLERGGGQDQPYLADSLTNHQARFGRAPDLLAADRGWRRRPMSGWRRRRGSSRWRCRTSARRLGVGGRRSGGRGSGAVIGSARGSRAESTYSGAILG